MTPKKFQTAILNWFDIHGRKHLPWQENKTPYRVWISEIMLQQTQVSTVIPYFLKFMQRFPDIHTLANAKEDDVLHLWTGLGYYTRARNLHRSAKIISHTLHGKFPSELETLEALPGIGRSTAGAILSIAFEKRAAILDGNVKRVLVRFHGIEEWPGEKTIHEKLWQCAEKYTPASRTADYAQAMMDMGATLCVRGKPLCAQCPLQTHCLARQLNIEKTLPKKKPSKKLPQRDSIFLILRNEQNEVLLEKRPPIGIWAGLWSLPEITLVHELNDIIQHCEKKWRCKIKSAEWKEGFRHTFSHFHLNISPIVLTAAFRRNRIMEDEQQIWYNVNQPAAIGLPAPVKSLLGNLP